MKAFIGQYYKTAKQAIKAWEKLSEEMKTHRSVCEMDGSYFLVGNSTIRAFNKTK